MKTTPNSIGRTYQYQATAEGFADNGPGDHPAMPPLPVSPIVLATAEQGQSA